MALTLCYPGRPGARPPERPYAPRSLRMRRWPARRLRRVLAASSAPSDVLSGRWSRGSSGPPAKAQRVHPLRVREAPEPVAELDTRRVLTVEPCHPPPVVRVASEVSRTMELWLVSAAPTVVTLVTTLKVAAVRAPVDAAVIHRATSMITLSGRSRTTQPGITSPVAGSTSPSPRGSPSFTIRAQSTTGSGTFG